MSIALSLVARCLFRESIKHPLQLLLTLFSIAAGVAVVVGVDIVNDAATREFTRANQLVDGVATHRITAGVSGIDESIYRKIKVELGIRNAAPVIELEVAVENIDQPFTLFGIDPVSDFRIRQLSLAGDDSAEPNVTASMMWPLWIADSVAASLQSEVTLRFSGRSQEFNIVGRLRSQEGTAAVAMKQMLVSDIAWVQDFSGMAGRLSYIDLNLPAGYPLDRLKQQLPASVQLLDVARTNHAEEEMTRAFRTNLTALSLLALLIAAFLIYSSVSFQMVRRAKLFGLLRVCGVSSTQVSIVLSIEIMLLTFTGVVLGLMLGILLANGLGSLVTQTINALYHSLAEPAHTPTVFTLLKALSIGMVVTLIAAIVPLYQQHKTTPLLQLKRMRVMRSSASKNGRLLLSATGLFLFGSLLMFLSRQSLFAAFAGLFAMIAAMALLTPLVIRLLAAPSSRLQTRGWLLHGKMAWMNSGKYLDRNAVAIAALAVAVSATLGVGLMIDSFRYSVHQWLEGYLRADVYMTSEEIGQRELSPVFLEGLSRIDGLEGLSTGNRMQLTTDRGVITLFVLDVNQQGFDGFQFIAETSNDHYRAFQRQDSVLVTEPYALKNGLTIGNKVSLPTDSGIREFTITGIYTDYSSDQGLVTISRPTWSKYVTNTPIVSAALYLKPEVDVDTTIKSLRSLPGAPTRLFVRSNRGLRDASMIVFDQTFRITAILRWLAVVVAVIGIVSALMALQLDRAREYASLKAVGFSRSQLAVQMMLETGLNGLYAGILAIPMGLVLAVVLIDVINVRSFGWSMHTVIDPGLLLESLLLSVFAAVVAAVYPILRMMKTPIVQGLRDG